MKISAVFCIIVFEMSLCYGEPPSVVGPTALDSIGKYKSIFYDNEPMLTYRPIAFNVSYTIGSFRFLSETGALLKQTPTGTIGVGFNILPTNFNDGLFFAPEVSIDALYRLSTGVRLQGADTISHIGGWGIGGQAGIHFNPIPFLDISAIGGGRLLWDKFTVSSKFAFVT